MSDERRPAINPDTVAIALFAWAIVLVIVLLACG